LALHFGRGPRGLIGAEYPFRERHRAPVATPAPFSRIRLRGASRSNRASSLSTSAAKRFFQPCGMSLVTSDSWPMRRSTSRRWVLGSMPIAFQIWTKM
jgi:hypothetical protein